MRRVLNNIDDMRLVYDKVTYPQFMSKELVKREIFNLKVYVEYLQTTKGISSEQKQTNEVLAHKLKEVVDGLEKVVEILDASSVNSMFAFVSPEYAEELRKKKRSCLI